MLMRERFHGWRAGGITRISKKYACTQYWIRAESGLAVDLTFWNLEDL